MYKVIVSGANSFIGMELVRQLGEKGYKIFCLVRANATRICELRSMKNVKIIYYSLDHMVEIYDDIGETCDVFVHLAWMGVHGRDRNDSEIQSQNVKWTFETFETAKAMGCQTFILAGSQAEYGSYNGKIINEGFPCHPSTQYGIQKLKAFEYLMDMSSKVGIRVIEPRFFSVFGPYDSPQTLVMTFVSKMLNNEECILVNGEQRWDYLYISDAAKAVIRLIENSKCYGSYNVASGDIRTLKEYAEDMKTVLNSKSVLSFGTGIPTRKSDLMADVSRLKKIGWRPEISFEQGIILTMKYLKAKGMR